MRRKSVFEDKQPCEEEDSGLWEQFPGTREGHGGSPYLSLGSRINLVWFWLSWTIWYLHLINVIEKLYLKYYSTNVKRKMNLWRNSVPLYHAKAYKSPIKNLTWRGWNNHFCHLLWNLSRILPLEMRALQLSYLTLPLVETINYLHMRQCQQWRSWVPIVIIRKIKNKRTRRFKFFFFFYVSS